MTKKLLKEIDAAIARLQKARTLLIHDRSAANRGTKPTAKGAKAPKKKSTNKHHTMSEEGRERVRQAQLKRWATVKKKTKRDAA
jgi:hypothetical protein